MRRVAVSVGLSSLKPLEIPRHKAAEVVALVIGAPLEVIQLGVECGLASSATLERILLG